MTNKAKTAMIALLGAALMMSSCVVTKKRYDTAVMNGKKSLDSLNKVFDETVAGFNKSMNTVKSSNAGKDITLDSLMKANSVLNLDKKALNLELRNAITEYEQEKIKLIQKSRTVDSLMSIIEAQKMQADSIANQNTDGNQQN